MSITVQEYEARFAVDMHSYGSQPVFGRPEDGGRLEAVRLPSGGVIGLRCPASCDPNDSSNEVHEAFATVRTVAAAAAEAARVRADERLSDTAKTADAAKHWTAAASKVAALQAKVSGDFATFENFERGFFAPPPVTDPVAQLADMEARQWIAAQPVDALPGIVAAMHAGERHGLLVACMRSPVPLPAGIGQALPAAWRAHLERSQPEMLRAVEARRERLEWLRERIDQSAAVIPKAAQGITHRAA